MQNPAKFTTHIVLAAPGLVVFHPAPAPPVSGFRLSLSPKLLAQPWPWRRA